VQPPSPLGVVCAASVWQELGATLVQVHVATFALMPLPENTEKHPAAMVAEGGFDVRVRLEVVRTLRLQCLDGIYSDNR
jgi:hypothetical protein